MKQKIKKLFIPSIHPFTYSPLYRERGFTLIEIAMVLVVIGILLTIGAGLVGILTKRAKLNESREIVKAAREAVLGYAVKNGYLPANLEAAGARKVDAWGNDLLYYPTTEFDASPEDACGVNTTAMQVYECLNTGCSSYNTKSNIAFVVFSKGPDGNEAGTGTTSPFRVRLQDDAYTSGGTTYNYDDIVAYASLDEIRSLRGCPQPLAITSPSTLPQGEEDSFYSYSLEAIGGKPPYTWSGSAGSGLNLNSAGLISGTINVNNTPPNTGELTACSASIPISATVNDSAGSPSQSYTGSIPVRPKPLTIITQSLPSAYEGSPYSASISASGGRTPYSWSMSVSPSCPSGLTCSGNSITGTPAAGTAGTYTITSTVNDTCTTNTRNFVLTINPSGGGGGCTPLSLTPPSGTSWSINVGDSLNQTISVSGGQSPYTNTQCTPASCNGLSLSCTNNNASISGTANASGTCTFNVSWQDSCTDPGPQTISGTYTVNITGGLPPTCALSASPGIVRYNQIATLSWTITNGPANGTFSPTSGTCTSFSNSNSGSCTTAGLIAPPCTQTFTLTVSNANGSSTCSTTLYVGRSEYMVWNNTGQTKTFVVDNVCRLFIPNNNEITTTTERLNVGEIIQEYTTKALPPDYEVVCFKPVQNSQLTYDQAMSADSQGNCDGKVNFTGTDR